MASGMRLGPAHALRLDSTCLGLSGRLSASNLPATSLRDKVSTSPVSHACVPVSMSELVMSYLAWMPRCRNSPASNKARSSPPMAPAARQRCEVVHTPVHALCGSLLDPQSSAVRGRHSDCLHGPGTSQHRAVQGPRAWPWGQFGQWGHFLPTNEPHMQSHMSSSGGMSATMRADCSRVAPSYPGGAGTGASHHGSSHAMPSCGPQTLVDYECPF